MGVVFTIGLILSIIAFLLSRRLVEPISYIWENHNRIPIPGKRVKYPIIIWIGFIICSFIPIINIICSVVCIIIMLFGVLEEEVEFKWGNFMKSIINFFSKRF